MSVWSTLFQRDMTGVTITFCHYIASDAIFCLFIFYLHTLVHIVKGLRAQKTVPSLALEGSLKNFLRVLHSLVVKCMAAYHFQIPSENRCCCVECQMLMFVPLLHAISFNYVQIEESPKIFLFCDFHFLHLFSCVSDR